jgi:glycopeptide antibiotics resistance protein
MGKGAEQADRPVLRLLPLPPPDRAGLALPEHYGWLLNVVLFVPVGVALCLLVRRPWWQTTLVATAASALVELAQATLVERVGSVSDVVANGLGALLGALAITGVRRLRARR